MDRANRTTGATRGPVIDGGWGIDNDYGPLRDVLLGRPEFYRDYAYQRRPYDRPFRWYDAAIPYDFPEVLAPTSYTDGERRRITRPGTGYMYDAIGDWRTGRLSWSRRMAASSTP